MLITERLDIILLIALFMTLIFLFAPRCSLRCGSNSSGYRSPYSMGLVESTGAPLALYYILQDASVAELRQTVLGLGGAIASENCVNSMTKHQSDKSTVLVSDTPAGAVLVFDGGVAMEGGNLSNGKLDTTNFFNESSGVNGAFVYGPLPSGGTPIYYDTKNMYDDCY